MVYIYPFFILAEVPPIFCSNDPIVANYSLKAKEYLCPRSRARMQVIILVNEAIYTCVLLLRETMTW